MAYNRRELEIGIDHMITDLNRRTQNCQCDYETILENVSIRDRTYGPTHSKHMESVNKKLYFKDCPRCTGPDQKVWEPCFYCGMLVHGDGAPPDEEYLDYITKTYQAVIPQPKSNFRPTKEQDILGEYHFTQHADYDWGWRSYPSETRNQAHGFLPWSGDEPPKSMGFLVFLAFCASVMIVGSIVGYIYG